MRYNLAIPYAAKDIVKETYPIRFDPEQKSWYYECKGELPKDMIKYKECLVDIKYDEKDDYKAKFSSLRWNSKEKSWVCSAEDFEKIQKYKADLQ